jgi:hypothetical protein
MELMSMKDHIVNYYVSERQGATWIAIIAFLIVLTAIIVWRTSSALTFQRGLAVSLLIVGALMLVATIAAVLYNNQRIKNMEAMMVIGNHELQQMEIVRMTKVLSTAYTAGLITFSLAILMGTLLMLFMQRQFIRGMGTGLLLFGILGVSAELISLKRNGQYSEEIRRLNFKNK